MYCSAYYAMPYHPLPDIMPDSMIVPIWPRLALSSLLRLETACHQLPLNSDVSNPLHC